MFADPTTVMLGAGGTISAAPYRAEGGTAPTLYGLVVGAWASTWPGQQPAPRDLGEGDS